LFIKAYDIDVSYEEATDCDDLCVICNKKTDKGFPLYTGRSKDKCVVGENYGDYPSLVCLSWNTTGYYVCPECKALFQGNTFRNIQGVFAWYSDENNKGVKILKGDDSVEDFLNLMLNPPKGYFFCAFNRIFSVKHPSKNPAHFLYAAVVNYNWGGCGRYYATAYTEAVEIDISFAKEYIHLVKHHNQIVTLEDIYLGANRNRNKVLNELSLEKALYNIRCIEIINRLLKKLIGKNFQFDAYNK
ncbi:MAG: hypothetical protein ACPLSA_04525, partial [Caldanaerobacter sp.]